MSVSAAYRHCERIVRARARNFSYGIRLLPPPKRRALSAVYAFARRIDDIGDGDAPALQRLAGLADARDALREAVPDHTDLVLVALRDAARRYPIPMDAFEELIDGCVADVRGASYESSEDLLYYCRCVAGSVGRLSLGVFGSEEPAEAAPLADALGVALQLTNILRDVREDRRIGRIYLPAEDLKRFGCALNVDPDGRFTDAPEDLTELMRYEADQARVWYERGVRLLPLLDRRSAACAAAMTGIYRSLLDRIAADPVRALGTRLSLSTWDKTLVAARALTGARR
ncbi:presqualene diphosphate synthase HpnD [Actinomadura sp. HBU206391]|uniref:presqualene diphosphate synthase HpnD n=1 Tax=Actinomadura sp. HBU206391 TaxID=2731692 RepID=UPI001650D0AE|nr:presqualene diphosphate synthase HpnD [Actinomadura sp. HBU206391]MBC6462770.1 presqualene diphosphate synthase HpnD [Actinomadura sp. HBU206391]